ncbi:MAG: radical SAM protein [Phycisphaerae bacterium]|jgi:predicted DNA-binding helix-hairpin-helix protein
MDTQRKLEFLADASQYDLACACGTQKDGHRVRGPEGKWLYPVSLPNGGTSILLKTLLSNVCVNQCRYCPFRASRDVPRTTLSAEEIASVFLGYVRQQKIHGLFLSSGVLRDADYTMGRLLAVAALLRKRHQYRGYIHLKIIPGASDAAIAEALSLASAVSLNVEAPHRAAFRQLSPTKDFDRDIVGGIRKIHELTAPGAPYAGVKQTTQFVVGAADEKDADIVRATFGLYRRMKLSRVYFSAYQRGLGDPQLPGERPQEPNGGLPGGGLLGGSDLLTREHRLYQVDWLIRKYGFSDAEIPFQPDGNLSLQADPKTIWAQRNPQFFPLDVNKADRFELLRVPGLGPIAVKRILTLRAEGSRIRSLHELAAVAPRLHGGEKYFKLAR